MLIKLAAQQTALLDLLHHNDIKSIANYSYDKPPIGVFDIKHSETMLRGLRAYRANAQALAHSALSASYPVLEQLIGADNFRHLAEDFWQAKPPQRGDLAQWGHGLAAYLMQVPQLQSLLQDHPYLPDIAQVEWALHAAATASDASLDAESFKLLATHDPAALGLLPASGCAVVHSRFPVVAVMAWHDLQDDQARIAAQESLAQQEAQTALIWRRGLRPEYTAIDAGAAAMIEASLQAQSLEVALSAALERAPAFDFSACLSESVQNGIFIAVRVISPTV
jgi:Putative DNA-binding domain